MIRGTMDAVKARVFKFSVAFVALVGAFTGGIALGSGPITGEASVDVTQTSFRIDTPATIAAGQPFTMTVTVVDQNGATIPTFVDKVKFESSDDTATLPPTTTFSATNHGVRKFIVVLRDSGSQKITVTDVTGQSITTTTTVTTT